MRVTHHTQTERVTADQKSRAHFCNASVSAVVVHNAASRIPRIRSLTFISAIAAFTALLIDT